MAVIAGCSSDTPTAVPSPTPTAIVPSEFTIEEAGAFMRAVIAKEPGCAALNLVGASFSPVWEPTTKSWLVQVTTAAGQEGDYRILEERGFTVDTVNHLISDEC